MVPSTVLNRRAEAERRYWSVKSEWEALGNMMEEKEKKTLTTCSPEQLSENHFCLKTVRSLSNPCKCTQLLYISSHYNNFFKCLVDCQLLLNILLNVIFVAYILSCWGEPNIVCCLIYVGLIYLNSLSMFTVYLSQLQVLCSHKSYYYYGVDSLDIT